MDELRYAELKEMVRDGFSGINGRLDAMNGKVSTHQAALAVLQDRSDRQEKQAGVYGAVTGGVVSGIILAVKAMFFGGK